MAESRPTIRVLFCDDDVNLQKIVHHAFRDEGVTFVGDAENGSDAVALALEHEPDVVIMDLGMPRFDGIEATRRIAGALPATRIVIYSGRRTPEHVESAFLAGASGYVAKPWNDELVRAVRAVSLGHSYVSV
jgi:DNA-binding NarL/FixJ family response regulator